MADSGATRIAEAAARGAREAGEQRLPGWVAFLLTAVVAMAVPLAAGAVGYGEIKARVSAVEQRLERAEVMARDDRAAADRTLGDLRATLQQVQIDTARICARVNCDGSPGPRR